MEKLVSNATEEMPMNQDDSTLSDLFCVPFWPIQLHRPMRLFRTSLGLEPGVQQAPSADFLVKLISDAPSHQAWLRQALGSNYKNLENLVKGKGERSATTLALIEATLPGLADVLAGRKEARDPTGPFLPELLQVVQLLEGIPFKLFEALKAHELNCPHCGANVLRDVDSWWSQQVTHWGESEYRFADRLISVLLSATAIRRLGATGMASDEDSLENVLSLAEPSKHPFGHWMRRVMQAHKVKTYAELANTLPFDTEAKIITDQRLRKWASGRGDLISLAAGHQLTVGLTRKSDLDNQLIAARVIAFAVDFLCAATPEAEPDRSGVQAIVHHRLGRLWDNAILAIKVASADKVSIVRATT